MVLLPEWDAGSGLAAVLDVPALRGITISVSYGPLLAITLPLNMRHLESCLVVTSPEDHETQDVAFSVPGVSVFETDAFTRHGARFNKGLAYEEGFDKLGRAGWILIWDADCIFPSELPLDSIQPTKLYGCRRRILEDPCKWSESLDWRTCPVNRDGGPIGYFQLAHADDPVLKHQRPWYEVSFSHAGGGDAWYMEHWHPGNRIVLPFDVLHLGPIDTHWFGTDQAGKDLMAKFVRQNGWHRATQKHSQESASRAPEIVERVKVPGYEPTGYELPFVKRAKRAAGR